MQREAWGEAGAVCGGEWAPFEAISRPGEGGGKSGVEGEISGGCVVGGIKLGGRGIERAWLPSTSTQGAASGHPCARGTCRC